ncbi:MAG: hypothetical protein ACLPV8_08425 [Steroidobacteraceae bacterium]
MNQLGLTEWIGALLVVFVALTLTGSPTVGAVVARSKWTPIVWVIAFGIGCVGELLLRRNVFVDRRFAVAYWAPVYEFFIYSLALSLFHRFLKRAPQDVSLNWNSGLLWDRIFAIVVGLASILPMALLIKAR